MIWLRDQYQFLSSKPTIQPTMSSSNPKLFIITGPPASGKSKLIQLLQSQPNNDINQNSVFLNAIIHCSPKFSSYFENRGYEVKQIQENFPVENDTMFKLDDLLWIEIPDKDQIDSHLQEGKNVILKLTGTRVAPIQKLIHSIGESRVRVILIDCSTNESKWTDRLKQAVVWDDYEIERFIQNGKHYITQEIPQNVKYFELVDNDSSLEEGLGRLIAALKRARVHAEDVDQFFDSKHETLTYLNSLNIQDLLEHLMTQVLIEQPEDPKQYLIDYLSQLKQQSSKSGNILNEDDLEALFQMIDLTGQGKITKDQMRNCLRNLVNGGRASGASAPQPKTIGENEARIEKELESLGDEIDAATFKSVTKKFVEVKF